MRICYLCPDPGIPIFGSKGASAHVREFVKALQDLGNEVLVLASNLTGDEGGRDFQVGRIRIPEFVDRLPDGNGLRQKRALRHVLNNVSVETELKKVISTFHPELIYERYSPFSAAGGIISREHGIKHVLEVNAPLASEGKLYRHQALQEAAEFLEASAFSATSLIVAVSHQLSRILEDQGVSQSKIVVVPNGVDPDRFRPRKLHVSAGPADKTVIGFVGNLRPWHAVDFLCEVYAELASDEKFELVVVGDGPQMDLLLDLRSHFPDRIVLAGAVSRREVSDHLRAMDIGVAPYPALREFYFSPLKVFEYMAAGLPVVATRIGQLTEVVDDGRTGTLVDAGDVRAFAEAIRCLAADRQLRLEMGRAAVEVVRSTHTWKHRVSQILGHVNQRSGEVSLSGASLTGRSDVC